MGVTISGGALKGRTVKTPKGHITRPTSNLLRQALFNICQNSIEEARFLDLFGGSGAIGIEALSRGASHATFVEKDKAAFTVLKQNLKELNLLFQAKLLFGDAIRLLPALKGPFDIVYIDPPYKTDIALYLTLIEKLDSLTLLADEASLFIEESHDLEKTFQALSLHHLKWVNSRKFGSTYLHKFYYNKIVGK